MSLKKYSSSKSDCGCVKVQMPPEPCCESHTELVRPGNCYRPTSNVTTNTEQFFLTFDNTCIDEVPINSAEVFFYHAGAGLIRIIGLTEDGVSYKVQLVDPSKEGHIIQKGDCVLVHVITQSSVSSSLSGRCLSGQFVVPTSGQSGTMLIYNGSGIPIGSNLTLAWDGELGTYTVQAFVSASGNIYAYTVKNDGSGHSPAGTIIDAGNGNECLVPIEVITNIDICDLSTTNPLDTITGCLNGSPRAMVPVGDGYVPMGSDGKWDQRKIEDTVCCVVTDGVLKLSGNGCTQAQDTVKLRDTGLECFEEAYQIASAASTFLTVTATSGDVTYTLIVQAYDSSDDTLTLRIFDLNYLGEDEAFIEFLPGTQLCLGECCKQCTNGPNISDINTTGDGDTTKASSYVFEVTLPYHATDKKHYLVGLNTSGAVVAVEITSTYNDVVEPGIGKPAVTDPLVMRQKICNTSQKKCVQQLDIEYNYELAISNIPANLRVHYEVGDYIANSATLIDGTTANTLSGGDVASQADSSGYIDGPNITDSTVLPGTVIGLGGIANTKVWPKKAAFFKDSVFIRQCDCANIRTWLYIQFDPLATVSAASASLYFVIRRRIIKQDVMVLPMPRNLPSLEGFAT